ANTGKEPKIPELSFLQQSNENSPSIGQKSEPDSDAFWTRAIIEAGITCSAYCLLQPIAATHFRWAWLRPFPTSVGELIGLLVFFALTGFIITVLAAAATIQVLRLVQWTFGRPVGITFSTVAIGTGWGSMLAVWWTLQWQSQFTSPIWHLAVGTCLGIFGGIRGALCVNQLEEKKADVRQSAFQFSVRDLLAFTFWVSVSLATVGISRLLFVLAASTIFVLVSILIVRGFAACRSANAQQ
ncbi:MAG: hypothetical protein AAGD11_13230, partial [Planctomycetota bacterium]